MTKKAIITGISGQDGRLLADFLTQKGYAVIGVSRRTSTQQSVRGNLKVVTGDISDPQFLSELIESHHPDEFYNLAAQSFIEHSWKQPIHTVETTGVAVLNCLEALRRHSPATRFFQAASSELFGDAAESPQNERSVLHPRSPYATAKLLAYWSVRNYRDRYGIFAANGILYNHESIYRGLEFVTRKVSHAAARIKLGRQEHLEIGSMSAQRDWGWAPDYVEAMWLSLQHGEPDDFVVATGKLHTVQQLVEAAFAEVGLDWTKYVRVDQTLVRKAEPVPLCGDASKARIKLGWTPRTDFATIIKRLVQHDLSLVEREGCQ